jgi:hypothetical protein
MLRWALQTAAFASLATTAAGCVVTVEPGTQWLLDPITKTATYEAGDGVRVDQQNGEVSIERGSGSEISAVFEPFTFRADDEEEEASAEMKNDLTLTVEDQGGYVLVRVAKADGSSGYLGAHVTVTLPADFSGGIEVDSDNGGLDLRDASGQLTIDVNNGTSTIEVDAWSPLDGTVNVGNGDLEFTVASGLEGSIEAIADGADPAVIGPDPMPADWDVTETSATNKTFTFGTDPTVGGTVTLTTGNGDITIFAE